MTDIYTKQKRSEVMSRIASANTKPEMVVRSLLHRSGLRFRIHRTDLPGKPDVVLKKHRTVIFVHGCFWHGHTCKKGRSLPKSNSDFWQKKIRDNVARDQRNKEELKKKGWSVLEIWECETRETEKLSAKLSGIMLS